MLVMKLLLVALSVLLATLAARRFGHAVGGAVAGMPMIAGPITAVLLIDHDAAQVRAIALATLVCLPASIVHIVSFAHAASRVRWPVGLALALAAYLAAGALLTHMPLPPAAVCLLAMAVPSIGLWLAPRGLAAHGPVTVPHSELVLRITAAAAMAAAIIVGADTLPASLSGLLLAVPITGSVLPCFTLPRHGAAATASLMRGFIQGLHGFAAFFVTLYVALGWSNRVTAFCVALVASLAAAALVQALRRAARRRRPVEQGV
jgi:uncharacterized membrane protein (GlpM family)